MHGSAEQMNFIKKYHDEEWENQYMMTKQFFEFLVLESFQAGLSWITILRKRENFRKAFDNFDYQKIANYPDEKSRRTDARCRNYKKPTKNIGNYF